RSPAGALTAQPERLPICHRHRQVDIGGANAETPARLFQRLGKQGLVVEAGQPVSPATRAPSLPDGTTGRYAAILTLDLAGRAPANEGKAETAGLTIGEGDHTGLAEGICLVT